MGGVFINYRTGDGDWAATVIARELAHRIGAENVFFASKSIRVGQDFVTRILDQLGECEVFLAIVGARWLAATDRHGSRRLDNPEDWVRREIIQALRLGLRVIPVHLDATAAPAEADLPAELDMLARCPGLRLRHDNEGDLVRLLDEIDLLTARPQVDDDLGAVTSWTLDALHESRYPISASWPSESEAPAALQERLVRYERDMTRLLRLTATTVYLDGDERALGVHALGLLLNRRDKAPTSYCQPWLAAESYPALLLSYTIGIASMAAGHDDLAYRQLMLAKSGGPGREELPALQALALRQVVDPQYCAAFPKWRGVRHPHALSVHLRQALQPVFHHLSGDREYELAFEEYEYLRSLLELHRTAFTSLGEFAFHLARGTSTVDERMTSRLTADSALLRAGAFDSTVACAVAARRQLGQDIRGRYR